MNYLSDDIAVIENYFDQLKFGGSTIMVTGSTGLIGSIIVKSAISYNKNNPSNIIKLVAMARNKDKALSVYKEYFSSAEDAEKLGIIFCFQDICSPIDTKIKCDYIIHTANATNSKFLVSNPVEVMDSIYIGTRNVLEYAKNSNAKGAVYLSSMEVFGSVDSKQRITENGLGYVDIQNVRSCYPEGKRLAECMCKAYCSEYGVPVKVARLAQTFGAGVLPSENRVFAQFARSAVKGEDIVLHTTGESMGNYCYTTDAIAAILLLLKKGEWGEAYTVVNEEMTMEIRQMAQLIINEFSNGKGKVVFDIPESNIYGYAATTKMKLSSEKIRQLGWEPKVNMVSAYKRMIPDLF